MAAPSPGERVLVPTDVKLGAFPGEKLVTVATTSGPVSGFTKVDYVINQDGDQYLLAEVKQVLETAIRVKLFGSFFTTTGIADIPKSTALRKAAR
jgi:hypothetical protein